jgi:hypothetical protein
VITKNEWGWEEVDESEVEEEMRYYMQGDDYDE